MNAKTIPRENRPCPEGVECNREKTDLEHDIDAIDLFGGDGRKRRTGPVNKQKENNKDKKKKINIKKKKNKKNKNKNYKKVRKIKKKKPKNVKKKKSKKRSMKSKKNRGSERKKRHKNKKGRMQRSAVFKRKEKRSPVFKGKEKEKRSAVFKGKEKRSARKNPFCSNKKTLQGQVGWALDRKGKQKVRILASGECREMLPR